MPFVTNKNPRAATYGLRLFKSGLRYYLCHPDGTPNADERVLDEVQESQVSESYRVLGKDGLPKPTSRRGTRSPQTRLNLWAKRYDKNKTLKRTKSGDVIQSYLTDDQLKLMSGFNRGQWYQFYRSKIDSVGGNIGRYYRLRRDGRTAEDAARRLREERLAQLCHDATEGRMARSTFAIGSEDYKSEQLSLYKAKLRRRELAKKRETLAQKFLAVCKAVEKTDPNLINGGFDDEQACRHQVFRAGMSALRDGIVALARELAVQVDAIAHEAAGIIGRKRNPTALDTFAYTAFNRFRFCRDNGSMCLPDEGSIVDGRFYRQAWVEKNTSTCPCCQRQRLRGTTGFRKFVRDEGDEYLYPGIEAVCDHCLSHRFYQWRDGTFHTGPQVGKCRHPDQGASQRESEIWLKMMELHQKSKAMPIKYAMPGNSVDIKGINAIVEFFSKNNNRKLQEIAGYVNEFLLREGPGVDPHAVTVEWRTSGGLLPKRISRFVKEKFDVKMSNDELGALGSLAGGFAPKESSFVLDVTNGRRAMTWSPGDFGDSGSCLWGAEKSYVRWQFETQHNAFAVRFFQPTAQVERGSQALQIAKQGVGRCWGVVQNGKLFLFNAYGPHSLLTTSRLLVAMMGGGFNIRNVAKLTNKGGRCPIFYINGTKGFVIGKEPEDQLPVTHDFNMEVAAAG